MLEGYGFISLWMIGFVLFMAWPLARSFYYSFGELTVQSQGLHYEYVGLANYRRAFTIDVQFLPIFRETIRNMVVQVPLVLVFSMFAALLLNRSFVGRTAFRGIFFLPTIVASGPVLVKLMDMGGSDLPIFQQYNMQALLTQFIPFWLAQPLLEMMDSIALVMWDSGVQVLIFLAGLQGVSRSLYEAAKIDGATSWEVFWKITFPIMMPIILVNTLFSIVSSFTGVNNRMLGYINFNAFSQVGMFGYASAIGWIYFIVIFIILGIVFYLFRNSASYAERR
jgi:ABC-type sugar transport system permease subunit